MLLAPDRHHITSALRHCTEKDRHPGFLRFYDSVVLKKTPAVAGVLLWA
jgi:hypothetical protein